MITSDSLQSRLFTDSPAISAQECRPGPSRSPLGLVGACNYVADILTCACVMFVIQSLPLYSQRPATHSMRDALVISVLVGLLSAVLLKRNETDNRWHYLLPVRETATAIRMSGQAGIVLFPLSYLLLPQEPGRLLLFLMLIPPLLTLERQWLAAAIRTLHEWNAGTYRVIVYGASEAGRRVASVLTSSTRGLFHRVAIIDEDPRLVDDCRLELAYRGSAEISVQCAAINADLLACLNCDLLILATTDLSADKRAGLSTAAAEAGSQMAQVCQLHLDGASPREFFEIGGLHLANERARRGSRIYAFGKRALDVLVSSFLLVLLFPVLLLISILVALSSPGPVLFVQKRVGLNGRIFRMYKFRSMFCNAGRYECSPKVSTDPRITRVGRLLRRTSLDELPQLLNVFSGDMSLVGPRPEMPFIVHRYTPHQRQRLQVLPGITGLWQLSADRAYPIHENLHYDLSYIRDRCLSLDLAILIHTFFFAMKTGV